MTFFCCKFEPFELVIPGKYLMDFVGALKIENSGVFCIKNQWIQIGDAVEKIDGQE